MRLAALIGLMLTIACVTSGCNRGPFAQRQSPLGLQPGQQQAAAQMQQLQQRLAQLDANNQDLHARLARTEVLREQNELLQQQLADMTRKYQAEQSARQDADKRLAAHQASIRQRGGATITANNSVRDQLQVVDVAGFEVEQEGDVIRIQLPADELFVRGTAQLKPGAHGILTRVATAVKQNYGQQTVGIEGHTDNGPLAPGITHHQLAMGQALAVFQSFTAHGGLSASQLFVMGSGANHPRFSNGDDDGRARNRRVELVIYPETVR